MTSIGDADGDLRGRVTELEHRVAALERVVGRPVQAPVGEPSELWASDEVRRLVLQGNKINAIKQFDGRDRYGNQGGKGHRRSPVRRISAERRRSEIDRAKRNRPPPL